AILLAAAGVTRLAADAPCAAPVLFEDMLPAPGQGALGVQIRESDGAIRELLRPLHDADAAACCEAERAVLQGLGGGCQLPLGTLAVIEGGVLLLRARVVSVDGRCACEAEVEGSPAEAAALGMRCVGKLLARGAAEILATLTLADPDAGYEEAVRSAREMAAGPLGGKRVLITRDEDADGPLSVALRALGADPLCLPLIRHVPPEDPEPLEAAARAIAEFDWIVFTSARAVDVLSAKIGGGAPLSAVRASIACVGPATARRVEHHGGHASWVSAGASAESLLRDLQAVGLCADQRVLFPRADKARETMAPGLRRLGAKLTEVIAYRTVPGGESRSVLEALRGGTVDAVLFCSPSAVEGLCETLGAGEARGVLAGLLVGSIGPTTTEALRQAGIEPGVEAADRSFEGLVRGLVKHLQGAEER
ncbi:uroporphyrinogen-III synthase, partial [Candidatus Poribacteria bacterium]|nr:uroporphyrinogen-III synthase [Candidatus Poribacteria bacterium]